MIRIAALALVLSLATQAHADGPQCHVIDVEITPTDGLQIVMWIEKPDGTFVQTIYITRKTGLEGLGNRPGRFDFNSGPPQGPGKDDMWPYGRRVTVFPVWAHRHGLMFPEVDFQQIDPVDHSIHTCCGDDNNLSHLSEASSRETTYCRPTMPGEPAWDAASCASPVFTDKGIFHPTRTSLYPPRTDVTRDPSRDSLSVEMYKLLDPFDAISQATPLGGTDTHVTLPVPELPAGDYVMWLEVSQAFDFNATYNATTYPAPKGIPWAAYGQPYRGQPSVVYDVPFTLGPIESRTAAQSYAGYGDPDGADGALRAPDATITTAASRLMMIAGSMDRVRVAAHAEADSTPPAAPVDFALLAARGTTLTFAFTAPGDDGLTGTATGYEIRYLANSEMTADNFSAGYAIATTVIPEVAGTPQTFDVSNLLPETDYWFGIRAFDDCHNAGPVQVIKVHTGDRQAGEVSACFIATAAYGSAMANEVEMLRRFRDLMLRRSVLGELAIETYYTFGPTLAGVIGESDLLRHTARDALQPLVGRIRTLR